MAAMGTWLRRRWYPLWFSVDERLFSGWRRRGKALTLGDWGERAARRYLLCLGYRIVGQNVRSRYGEIDLIAVDGDYLVFVEVKTLCDAEQDFPSDRVDVEKQKHLSQAASDYRRHRRLLDVPGRFDVISVWAKSVAVGTWQLTKMRHYQNAFESTLE